MTDTTTEAPEAQTADSAPKNSENTGLAGLKLAQLKALASQLGIPGASRMRKSDLVSAISAHQRGGAVADREAKKAPADSSQDTSAHDGAAAKEEAPKSKKSRDPKDQGDGDASSQSGDQGESSSDNAQRNGRSAQREGTEDQDSASEGENSGRGGRGRRQRGRNDDAGREKDSSREDRQQDNDSDEDSGSRRNRDNDRGDDSRGDRNDRRNRRNRNRNDRNRRGRNRGPDHDDTEVTEDDQLIPIAGIVDVLDNYAFVRTSGYLPGQNDVYVSLQQVKKNNLRKGDVVTGFIKAPQDNQRGGGGNNSGGGNNKRQKFAALVKVEKVNGRPAELNHERVDFSKLTPLYPQDRLRLEGDPKNLGPRLIDLVAPIGKGQRGLIVSPPKAGKTMILQALASAIKANNPEVHLMMVLVDERPEEVTDMQRTVDGEVIASTFDRPADDHTTVAELAIERAKRLVEMGKDVVVLLDSMTRLGRAYNTAAPASGRILSGGVDANALYPPKRFFGAARNIENGGSLTILATALVETGSKMDEVIFEEFKGTGNMELRLSRRLADKRIFPAISVSESSTRREENLLSPQEVQIMWKLRRVLSGLEQEQGLDLLLKKIKETSSNAEFLLLTQKTTLGGNGD